MCFIFLLLRIHSNFWLMLDIVNFTLLGARFHCIINTVGFLLWHAVKTLLDLFYSVKASFYWKLCYGGGHGFPILANLAPLLKHDHAQDPGQCPAHYNVSLCWFLGTQTSPALCKRQESCSSFSISSSLILWLISPGHLGCPKLPSASLTPWDDGAGSASPPGTAVWKLPQTRKLGPSQGSPDSFPFSQGSQCCTTWFSVSNSHCVFIFLVCFQQMNNAHSTSRAQRKKAPRPL